MVRLQVGLFSCVSSDCHKAPMHVERMKCFAELLVIYKHNKNNSSLQCVCVIKTVKTLRNNFQHSDNFVLLYHIHLVDMKYCNNNRSISVCGKSLCTVSMKMCVLIWSPALLCKEQTKRKRETLSLNLFKPLV